MADVRFDQLNAATTIVTTDLVAVETGGTQTQKATIAQLSTAVKGPASRTVLMRMFR